LTFRSTQKLRRLCNKTLDNINIKDKISKYGRFFKNPQPDKRELKSKQLSLFDVEMSTGLTSIAAVPVHTSLTEGTW
jgi:hypothetical protein